MRGRVRDFDAVRPERPKVGQVVRDASGIQYTVKAVGMKYLVTDKGLVRISDVFGVPNAN
jgi:hypothetical protein